MPNVLLEDVITFDGQDTHQVRILLKFEGSEKTNNMALHQNYTIGPNLLNNMVLMCPYVRFESISLNGNIITHQFHLHEMIYAKKMRSFVMKTNFTFG